MKPGECVHVDLWSHGHGCGLERAGPASIVRAAVLTPGFYGGHEIRSSTVA